LGIIVHMIGASFFLMNEEGFETKELDEDPLVSFNPINIIDKVDSSSFITTQLKDFKYFHQQAYLMFLIIYIILKLFYSLYKKII
jgi:hypothetical protein